MLCPVLWGHKGPRLGAGGDRRWLWKRDGLASSGHGGQLCGRTQRMRGSFSGASQSLSRGDVGASHLRALVSYPDCPEFSFPGPPRGVSEHSYIPTYSHVGLFSMSAAAVSVQTSYLSPGQLRTPPGETSGPLSVTHVLLPQSVLHFAE